jgi:dipeptidyl-peptidase 4
MTIELLAQHLRPHWAGAAMLILAAGGASLHSGAALHAQGTRPTPAPATASAPPTLSAPATASAPAAPPALLTAPERSEFQRYTTHDEMMDFLVGLRARSLDMRLGRYGESREGRELPYVILSRPLITQPSEAALLGRPVVLLAANVHGGERTLRESLLLLLRALATPGTPENALLDHMVILVAPQINPDGFHSGERGTRGNAWGVDLNRDYIKLEHPEIASYVGNLIHGWSPHLFVDGHNGGAYPYNVAYQCPSHASPDQRLTQVCDEEVFPFIDAAMNARGFKSWYYAGGTPTRWNTGCWQARIGRNYGGFANTVGILFESPGGQPMETAVTSGHVAYHAVLEYVRYHGAGVMATVNRARYETLLMGLGAEGEVVVDMRYGPEDRRVQYEIGVGQGADRHTVQVTSDSLMKKPLPTRTRKRPFAYVLPREATDAVAMLRRHNITVEQLRDSVTLDVEAYVIGDISYTQQYNHAAAVRVTVGDIVTIRRTFPRGSYVVPTGQALGRVVTHMLEPETDDNLIYWNTMDALLPRPQATPAAAPDPDEDSPPIRQRVQGPPLVPIFRLMQPTPLPASIVQ